jgi:hypothetical protein
MAGGFGNMPLIIEDRLSDSPYVERVWRSRSEQIDSMVSVAASRLDFVVTMQAGKTSVNILGPETKASRAPVPEEAEFVGIIFKPGMFMPHLPIPQLVDNNVALPDINNRFWLQGRAWELPTYDNADTFVNWLVRDGLIKHDPIIQDVLNGYVPDLSLRSIQRRFLRATGLTQSAIQQIERAREATIRLKEGRSILDTVYELGYFDQPHLTHALRHYIGQTPAQLADVIRAEQLSYLYKTTPLLLDYDVAV